MFNTRKVFLTRTHTHTHSGLANLSLLFLSFLLLCLVLLFPVPLSGETGECAGCYKNETSCGPGRPCKDHKRKHKHKTYKHVIKHQPVLPTATTTVITQRPVVAAVLPPPSIQKCRSCYEKILICPPIPLPLIECILVNPADIADFTCNDFPSKIKACEPYVCQAPSALDPTVATHWRIHAKKGERCVVSSTTENMGMKGDDGNALPVTQTCEYDEIGVLGLNRRFVDMQRRVYHFSTLEHFNGIHNCTFDVAGRRVRKP